MAGDFTEETAADAVIESFADTPDERLRTVLDSLVRHLHGFVRDVEPTIAEWERRTGLRATNLEFYEVFAGLRFAVVMIRIATLVTEFGLMPIEAGEDMAANNAVTRVLADLLGLPAPGPPPGDIAPAL